jgi:hypothetical protein
MFKQLRLHWWDGGGASEATSQAWRPHRQWAPVSQLGGSPIYVQAKDLMMFREVLPGVSRLTIALLAGLSCITTPARTQEGVDEAAVNSEESKPTAGMIFSFIPRVYTMAPTEGVGHRVLVVYAIPATRLTGSYAERDSTYPAHLRLRVVDAFGDSIVAANAGRNLVGMTSGADRYALGVEELALAPGVYSLDLYLGTRDQSIGMETVSRRIAVEDLQQASLWLSDLVLGRRGSGIVWEREEEVVMIDPLNTYEQGSSIEVYYEVVGLPDAALFETSITFTPVTEYNPVVEEHQSPLVSFGYDEVARSRFTPLRRTFNLGDFPPGRYRLTVAAHLPDGPAVTRETTIRVLGADEQE